MAKAVSMIESKDYEGAVRELEEVLKSRPNDEQATLYLGVALSRSGKREAEGMLKKALLINPQNPRTNLELGIYYLGRGLHGEAKDYFENTIKLAPNTEYSEKANEYLKLVKPEVVRKRWSLDVSAGVQYDSNVVLDSGASPLPEGISGKSDWRFVFDLSGRYNFLMEEKEFLQVTPSIRVCTPISLTLT
jgi:tetratricopeptide (TPR) repeat protein